MTRILIQLFLCIALAWPAMANGPRPLGQAMNAMRAGNWDNAARLAERDGQAASDVIEWHRLRLGRGTYGEVINFLDRNPDWPGLDWLRTKSEPAVALQSHAKVLAFFSDAPPKTATGTLAYARALASQGRDNDADAIIVNAWRSLRMSVQEQALYLGAYESLLKDHHAARLDQMLWQGWNSDANRMNALVSDGWRKLARARIALRKRQDDVNALINQIPSSLKSDPGLAYERFNWRASKGLESALELLLERSTSAKSLGRPEVWAPRRRSLARAQMRQGNSKRAYKIASQNFLESGSDFADLEWLSGYIALQKLNDPATALEHFGRFDAAVASPISKGRAGYWIGRAYQAQRKETMANAAFASAARYQTSFYGLLAAETAGLPFDSELTGAEEFGPWREAAFTQTSVFEASILLLASGEVNLAERFLTHMTETLSRNEAGKLGDMAIEMGRPHLAVMIGKRAARQRVVLPAAYYAIHPMNAMDLPMAPEMVLAIARRESEFDPVVTSGAGAHGLMQIMPATARAVAVKLGKSASHTTERLLTEWQYNAQLGSAFLSTLAGQFDGNVVMMSAAYNAGPGRPRRWMSLYGDPRKAASAEFDMVDWIEHIPFRETRNYVMRVTESLPIYRARLGLEPLPVPFSDELAGSTLSAFAPKGE
ncbi:MAG: lytic transglycosylase domain-containing protein [Paracoccaceae bacterium]